MQKEKKKDPQTITAAEFDRKVEGNEDVSAYMDFENAKFVVPLRSVNIDFPLELIRRVDREADRIGVTRTALIKMWVAERIDKIFPPRPPSQPAA